MLHVLLPTEAAGEQAQIAIPMLRVLQLSGLVFGSFLVPRIWAALRAHAHGGLRTAAVALTAAASLLPVRAVNALWSQSAAQAQSCASAGDWRRVMNHADDDRAKLEWSRPGCRIRMEIEGDVRFADDLRTVAEISRGGRLWIREDGRRERELELRPGREAAVVASWKVDGERRNPDAETSAWLEEMLTLVVRGTSYGMEQRVAQLMRQGGHDAVLDELPRVQGDHLQRRYLTELMEQSSLNAAALRSVLQTAAREIRSDHELAKLVMHVIEVGAADVATVVVAAEASREIASDHEQGRTLRALLARGPQSPRALTAVLVAAPLIASDHELGQVLAQIPASALADAGVRQAFFAAAATIASDHEHARMLGRIAGAPLDEAGLRVVLQSARTIESDHELASLLLTIARERELEGSLREEFLRTAETIQSEHEYGRVASALLRRGSASR